jgi:hypothetical protein
VHGLRISRHRKNRRPTVECRRLVFSRQSKSRHMWNASSIGHKNQFICLNMQAAADRSLKIYAYLSSLPSEMEYPNFLFCVRFSTLHRPTAHFSSLPRCVITSQEQLSSQSTLRHPDFTRFPCSGCVRDRTSLRYCHVLQCIHHHHERSHRADGRAEMYFLKSFALVLMLH